jgi:hypothetical protein
MRLRRQLTETEIAGLETRFGMLAKDGRLQASGPLEGEEEHLDLPRLHFKSKRRDFGVLRQLIDAINELDDPPGTGGS